MPVTIGNISLYMGPSSVGGPDDLQAAIVDFISGAQSRLEIAVQERDNPDIADAILAAKARGVSVRVVLEADYLRAHAPMPNPKNSVAAKKERHEIDRELHNYLLRAKNPRKRGLQRKDIPSEMGTAGYLESGWS